VRVVDRAIENPNPVGPNHEKYLMLGFAFGALISAMIIVVADIFDKSISSEEYLRQAYSNVPLLAVIPANEGDKAGYQKGYYESSQKRREAKRSGGAARR
jgi:capsular polysaccharide biosynthesis protein